jgi:predicted transcriptional regulator
LAVRRKNGAEQPEGDDLDAEERAQLHAAIQEGLDDMKAGRTYDAAEVIAELRART